MYMPARSRLCREALARAGEQLACSTAGSYGTWIKGSLTKAAGLAWQAAQAVFRHARHKLKAQLY